MSDWLTYSPKSGHGNGTITITADTLSELEDRVATIVASNSEYGVSDSVLITQTTVTPSTPLTFDIISGGTIYWYSSNEDFVKTISYSKNDGDWVEITSSTAGTPINVSARDVVKFKGDNSSYGGSNYYHKFRTTSDILFTVKGNIMSLIDSDGFATAKTLTDSYTFYKLFINCKGLVSAKNLLLPATTLTRMCYQYMFYDCTSLTTAPVLPATTLAGGCYQTMFAGCTSLTTAPELPATTLAGGCYGSMFASCTSLTTAPELPATTLAGYCYGSMFYNCTSLTTAPELPATTLAEYCYGQMFGYCTSLTTVPSDLLPATTLAIRCYEGMFQYCTSLTTAPELPATTLTKECFACYDGMFAGCTSLTTAPSILPATTLASECYNSMFNGCTKLKQAPELPATTLVERCYYGMFNGCTSLNYIKCLATDISASDCTFSWVGDITSIGTFAKNKNMTGWTKGISGIPSWWTVIDAT